MMVNCCMVLVFTRHQIYTLYRRKAAFHANRSIGSLSLCCCLHLGFEKCNFPDKNGQGVGPRAGRLDFCFSDLNTVYLFNGLLLVEAKFHFGDFESQKSYNLFYSRSTAVEVYARYWTDEYRRLLGFGRFGIACGTLFFNSVDSRYSTSKVMGNIRDLFFVSPPVARWLSWLTSKSSDTDA